MHFVDRKAKYPGRWTMKKSDGSSEIVTLIRNDEPEVEGTPMNAETLNTLSDVAGAEVARIEATKQAQSAAASADAAAKSQTSAATSAQAAQTSAGEANASAEKAAEEARKAANYVAADKTLSISDAPADAKAVGDALAGKANSSHTHDDRYYTESEMDGKLNGKANTSHTHDSVKDIGNNSSNTTFAYSKSGLAYGNYSWLAGWNGYELRAVDKTQFAASSHTHNYAGSGSAGGTANSVNGFKIVAQTSDPGAGSSLATNTILLVYK